MLLIFMSIQLVVQVSETTLAPPKNIHVNGGLLTWTPATEETQVNYTVQYRSFDDKVWKNVPACVHSSFNSCNFTEAESTNGCMTLRVQAERHGLTSRPVEACSKHGDSCTPEVSLSARPGSLTVYVNISPSLVQDHGGHAKHRVYFGKEGESLERNYQDGASSVSIHDLEQGQRYCIKVQYLLYTDITGTASCIQCEVIPESEKTKPTEVIVAVVAVFSMAILIPVIAYILIFHRKKIKLWLQPPYNIPDHFFDIPRPSHQLSYSSNEDCNIIMIADVREK
ncbi:interferon gamma receptor 2 [Anabas testudineus]|uniref:Fibronectin type-III domain-containing protein n=1 Tax=Anabas testudineus TaxID=64144 RepID=A0A7N5ZZS6_ANATE|nr:interferon gamma receptor 2 [Anabas testudineus]